VNIFGGRIQTLDRLKSMAKSDGAVILTEPLWIRKPVPTGALKGLNVDEAAFVTMEEMQQLVSQEGFQEIWHAVSTKEDWEAYVRPIFVTMQEFIKDNPDRQQDAQAVIDGFRAEYEAAGKNWDVVLWVIKPSKS
jgi:hypothetical protein